MLGSVSRIQGCEYERGAVRMADKRRIKWLKEVERHDFSAGEAYLRLLFPAPVARERIASLKKVKVTVHAAKDILRASELAMLPQKDPDVARQLKKIQEGEKLSPLLVVRESGHARLIVADGFHRLCAVNHLDPDEQVPCKIT
jgi:hypothetical protein